MSIGQSNIMDFKSKDNIELHMLGWMQLFHATAMTDIKNKDGSTEGIIYPILDKNLKEWQEKAKEEKGYGPTEVIDIKEATKIIEAHTTKEGSKDYHKYASDQTVVKYKGLYYSGKYFLREKLWKQ